MSRFSQRQSAGSSALFGCLIIQQFPVWAACYENPLLAVEPLIIHRKGRVYSACSRVLETGVRLGWDLQRAQSLCPAAKAQNYNANLEAYAWEEILKQLYGLTPRLEPHAPGALFFEPPVERSIAWLSTMAAFSKLVSQWNAQAGLAGDRATAELAARQAKPGEFRRIRDTRGFLRSAPIRALAGLGLSEDAIERLDWFGFNTVYELQQLTRSQIDSQFANRTKPNDARLLWRFARADAVDADRQPIQTYQLPPVEANAFEVRLARPTGEAQRAAFFDTRRYDASPTRFSPPRLLAALRNIESRYQKAMGRHRLRNAHAPLLEERFSYGPAVQEVP